MKCNGNCKTGTCNKYEPKVITWDDLPQVPDLPDEDPEDEFMHTILVPGGAWEVFAEMLDHAVKNQLYVYINGQKVELRSFDPYDTGVLTAHAVDEELHWLDGPDLTFTSDQLKVVRIA